MDPTTHLVENNEFRNSVMPYATEKKILNDYKTVLGANILLSNFSFFESYFFALIDEIIQFHGGDQEYLNFIERKISGTVTLSTASENHLKKLRVHHKKKDASRYDK